MAGYPKIWTTIRHEPWFKRLRSVQRSIWLQVILIAKEQTDDGWICFNNMSHFAEEVGCDRSNTAMWVAEQVKNERINVAEKSARLLHFYLINYNESQQVKQYKPDKTKKSSVRQAELKAEQSIKKEETVVSSGKPDGLQNRSPAQRWNDGVIETINIKIKKYWNNNTTIPQIIFYYGKAERSLGRVIICLERIREYELKTESIKNLHGRIVAELQNWTRWQDTDLAKVKQIDNNYEAEFKSKNSIKSIKDIFEK